MTLHLLIAGLLGLACVVGIWRATAYSPACRGGLIALNVVCAGLLYLLLLPPTTSQRIAADTLLVLTAGISAEQLAALPSLQPAIALPEVAAPAAITTWPDLASALRAYPDTRQLQVIGHGLPARDRDVARGYGLRFEPAALPDGLVELDAADTLAEGALWRISGRLIGAAVRVELLDPADMRVATSSVDAHGRFLLQTPARTAGRSVFQLQLLAADGSVLERSPLPLLTVPGQPLRIGLLAGAPNAELKYVRRWAEDAGLVLDSRIMLSRAIGVEEGDASSVLDPARLAATDLLILDERAWAALSGSEQQALRTAIDDGLGVLLRLTAPPDASLQAQWRGWGIDLQSADVAIATALEDSASADKLVSLTRLPLRAVGDEVTSLLRAADGTLLGARVNRGRGRIGALWLQDSYRLALAGGEARFGDLWAGLVGNLARPRARPEFTVSPHPRVAERVRICAASSAISVRDPAAALSTWLADPAAAGCVAWWPTTAGWHDVLQAGGDWPVFVQAADAQPALVAARTAAATATLVNPGDGTTHSADRSDAWPRWPFFLAWLASLSLLWWLQRDAVRRGGSAS